MWGYRFQRNLFMRSVDFLELPGNLFTINKIFKEVNLLALDYLEFLSENRLRKTLKIS